MKNKQDVYSCTSFIINHKIEISKRKICSREAMTKFPAGISLKANDFIVLVLFTSIKFVHLSVA